MHKLGLKEERALCWVSKFDHPDDGAIPLAWARFMANVQPPDAVPRCRYHSDLAGKTLLFRRIVMGVGYMGNLGATESLALAAALPDGIMHFRDRLLRTHLSGAVINAAIASATARRVSGSMKAFIVHNRRFLPSEIEVLQDITSGASTEHNVSVEYIRWPEIGSFQDHLRYVINSDIMVSGPGTGMMYLPLMLNNSAYVALAGVRKCNDSAVAEFMESHMGAGCPSVVPFTTTTPANGLTGPPGTSSLSSTRHESVPRGSTHRR